MGARLGIFVAFVLSLAAAGGSYYLYTGVVEERGRREKVEASYDQIKEKILIVQSEKEQVATEKDRFKAESEEYRARAQAMQGQIEQLQSEQTRSKEAQEALERQISAHLTTMADLQKKVEELDRKAKEAQQACLAQPEDLLPSARPFGASSSPITSISKPIVTPISTSVTSSTTVSKNAVPETFASSISSPPPVVTSGSGTQPSVGVTTVAPANDVTGVTTFTAASKGPRVLTVNRKFNFVVVNLGIQDGIKMGDKLTAVSQGGSQVTLQVEKLYDKFCAATILEENPQRQVAEGDAIRRG